MTVLDQQAPCCAGTTWERRAAWYQQPHSADANMEQRRRPEYNLDIFADLACVKDVVKGESILAFPAYSQTSAVPANRSQNPHFPCARTCTENHS